MEGVLSDLSLSLQAYKSGRFDGLSWNDFEILIG